tara:strand:- start:7695 stop:8669 length:975 start_codon:yes stop_codon:yes gene_type:complete
MIKKGRDFINEDVQILKTITDKIAIKTGSQLTDGVQIDEYHIVPKYGTGTISNFNFEEIEITISRYQLVKDLVYGVPFQKEILQISFLLTGEKIIYIEDDKHIYYENKESYMASIDQFSGYSRILGEVPFKEVKIKIPQSFLIFHGFMSDFDVKQLTDENLILPITDELLSILSSIERKDITGTANRMYLKAKVFELIAIQMENYKNRALNCNQITQDKILKKTYRIKQLIKDNLHKNYTTQQLGDEVGITGQNLNKEFIRVFGYTVNEFSAMEKMNKAKLMLENTQKLVYQIAEEIGYQNATHFSAAFKRRFGTTPKQYRKLN